LYIFIKLEKSVNLSERNYTESISHT